VVSAHKEKNERPVNFNIPAFTNIEDVILFFLMPAIRFACIIF
jgi:hypothetical protein